MINQNVKYSCPECNENADYQSDMWFHVKSVHPEVIELPINEDSSLFLPLVAEQNDGISQEVSKLKSQLSELVESLGVKKTKTPKQLDEELIKCLFCPRSLKGIKKLQVHIKTKHNVKTDCLLCGNKMVSIGALQKHILINHTSDNKEKADTSKNKDNEKSGPVKTENKGGS